MIKKLHVKNIALIDDMTLSFHDGLTALTGETGAGKSIIMESLQLLFGKRSDQDLIRHGYEEAVVSGDFILNETVSKTFDLPVETTITRVINRSGRHIMKLNGQTTTLQLIKQLTAHIGDIHEQDDMFQLLDVQSYVQMIDARDRNRIEPLKVNYMLKKSEYEEAVNKLRSLQAEKESFEAQKDVLLFQLQELDQMKLEIGELEAIQEEQETLKHFDKIANSLKSSVGLLKESNVLDALYDIKANLDIISHHMTSKEHLSKRFEEAYYDIKDIADELTSTLEHLDYNESHFQQLNEREFSLNQLQKKYQKDIPELIEYMNELQEKSLMVSDFNAFIEDQTRKIESHKKQAIECANQLSHVRKEIAKEMQKEMIQVMKALDLEHTKFDIQFEKHDGFLDHGLDLISFYISLNEGEPLKPLHKVASGGERARFMFALKTTAAKHHGVSLLILDEIDTGVSGKTAAKVAAHMDQLSKELQLIVITHLPQVAAKADHHILVEKTPQDSRMVTQINYLTGDDRIK
ncbi:MAG: DNA repair protein RecN, partial [Acholeplasmataceae bacterium]